MLLRRSIPSPAGSTTTRTDSTTHGPNRASIAATRIVAAAALALASLLAGALLTPDAATAAPQTAEVAPSTSAWFPSGAVPSGAIPTLPLVTAPVVVTGAHAVGQTLTVTAAWLPAPIALSYRWKRAGEGIRGATRSTYKLTRSDAGQRITVTVTGVKSGYSKATMTSGVVRVQKLLTATPIPTLTGHVAPGYILTARPGTWEPSPVTARYAWMVGGVVVGTGATYRVTAADAGKWIALWVTGSKLGYTSVTRMSLSHLVAGTPITR